MNDSTHEPSTPDSRLSEARFRAAAAAVGVLWTSDASGRMRGSQPSWAELTGQSEEAYQDHGWASAIHPEDAQPTMDAWQAAVAKKQAFEFEHRVCRRDGVWRRFTVRAAPVMQDGEVLEWVGVHIDITDHFRDVTEAKHTEDLLRRNRDTFYSLIQNNPFGMYVVDADFRVAQFSQGARKAFANVQPVIGRDFAEVMRTLWPESFASEAVSRFRHTLATGEPHTAGLVERRRDLDELEAYDWRIERVTLPDGRFGVVCHFYDLSVRQELEDKLRDSESRLRMATNAAKLGIWTWQPDADIVSWDNERPFEIFGLDPADGAVDAAEFVSEFLHPEDLTVFEQATARTLNDGAEFSFECRIRRRDGEERWIRYTGKGTPVGGPKAVQIVGTVEDITDRKLSEERLREFASRAARRPTGARTSSWRPWRTSCATRSPRSATACRSFDGSDPTAALEQATAMMERQVEQMVRLVDDLLDVSRISRDKLELRKARVDLVGRPGAGRRDQPAADRRPAATSSRRAAGRAGLHRCRRDPPGPGVRQPAQQRRQVHASADGRSG